MEIIAIVLFFLGFGSLFLGWRLQGSEENQDKTLLKGLALLRREIIELQGQVSFLEGEIVKIKLVEQVKEGNQTFEKKPAGKDVKELKIEAAETKELDTSERVETEEGLEAGFTREGQDWRPELKQQENGQKTEMPYISSKYQQVLELAASGHGVPEIAQTLLISQDAVQMVLKTQFKGATQ